MGRKSHKEGKKKSFSIEKTTKDIQTATGHGGPEGKTSKGVLTKTPRKSGRENVGGGTGREHVAAKEGGRL